MSFSGSEASVPRLALWCGLLAALIAPSSGALGGTGDQSMTNAARVAVQEGAATIENPCGAPDTTLAGLDAAQLFGAGKIPTFDFHLPADSWAWLQAHAREETYVPAQACLDGKAIGLVGLRFKGSYGSLFTCFNAAGENTCRKLSLKIKLDEYVPKQRLYGLERLNLQGYRYDNSYIKEALAFDLYRAMGIVAPRVTWALVRLNGESLGLYGLVEEVDGRFVKDRWPDNDQGNLYKEVWPGQADDSWLLSHLRTNKAAPDISAFKAFSAAVNAASSAELRAALGSYVDLDYFARYLAVDDAIGNFDGITAFYAVGSADTAGNHNYYFYQESPNRFTIIPWDVETSMTLSSGFGDVPDWRTIPADCSLRYSVWGGVAQVRAPGCQRVFQALASDLRAYRAAARRLLDGPLTEAAMGSAIDKYASFVRAAATVDPHGPGAAEFEKAVDFLKQDIPRLRARLERLIAGEPSSSPSTPASAPPLPAQP